MNYEEANQVLNDIRTTRDLKPGEPCEFRYPARRDWLPGTVVVNGGGFHWEVRDDSDAEDRKGEINTALYIEHVRALGTDPWSV